MLLKSIFGISTDATKPPKRTLKAMAQPLDITIGYEMSNDDCQQPLNWGVAILYQKMFTKNVKNVYKKCKK